MYTSIEEMQQETLQLCAFRIYRVGDWQLVSASSYFFQPQHFPSLFRHYFEVGRIFPLQGQHHSLTSFSKHNELSVRKLVL